MTEPDSATLEALIRMSQGPSPVQPGMDWMSAGPRRQPNELSQAIQQIDALRADRRASEGPASLVQGEEGRGDRHVQGEVLMGCYSPSRAIYPADYGGLEAAMKEVIERQQRMAPPKKRRCAYCSSVLSGPEEKCQSCGAPEASE